MNEIEQYQSTFARLLASENLKIEFANRHTASFYPNERKIVFPFFKVGISDEVRELFAAHEIGHALWTKTESFDFFKKNKIPHYVFNVVEDIRIERYVKDKFPGLRKLMARGYLELFNSGFFCDGSPLRKNPNVLRNNAKKLGVFDRLNLYMKVGFDSGVFPNSKEAPIYDLALAANTDEELLDVCIKLIQLQMDQIEEQTDKNEESEESDQSEESGEYGDSDEDDSEESDQSGEYGDSDEDDSEGSDQSGEFGDSEEDSEKSESKNVENGAKKPKEEFQSENFDKLNEMLKVRTQDTFDLKMKRNFEDSTEVGMIDMDSFHMQTLRTSFMNQKDVTSSFQKLQLNKMPGHISARAKSFAADFVSKISTMNYSLGSDFDSGDLDISKVWMYKFEENLFTNERINPNVLNHGIVVSIDCSGSMIGLKWETACKQMAFLYEFCKEAKIPMKAYGFGLVDKALDKVKSPYAKGYIHFGGNPGSGVVLLLDTDDQVSSEYVLDRILSISDYSNPHFGGTPLYASNVFLVKEIQRFKESKRIDKVCVINLTDGYDTGGLFVDGYRSPGVFFSNENKRTYKIDDTSIYGMMKDHIDGLIVFQFLIDANPYCLSILTKRYGIKYDDRTEEYTNAKNIDILVARAVGGNAKLDDTSFMKKFIEIFG